jgi:hypothetical protein
MRTLACAALVLLAGCGTEIDTTDLPSIQGYKDWKLVLVYSNQVPGHPDSYRTLYVNDVARSNPRHGRYPIGSVIVKEVNELEKDSSGTPMAGASRYVAVMRKVGDRDDVPVNDGWLFTSFEGTGGETQYDLCWQTCHKAAPFDGTWSQYGGH